LFIKASPELVADRDVVFGATRKTVSVSLTGAVRVSVTLLTRSYRDVESSRLVGYFTPGGIAISYGVILYESFIMATHPEAAQQEGSVPAN